MTISVTQGDCVAVLRARTGPLFDACVCDPPYELGFMGRAWDSSGVAFQVETWRAVFDQLKPGAHLVAFSGTRTYHRMAVAIEDAGFEIRDQLAWTYGSGFPKSLDVSKAIDKAAGAEREVVGPGRWNHVKGTADQSGCIVRPGNKHDETAPTTEAAKRWQGWGTALKPAWEPICLARKPLIGTVAANVLAHGTGGLNIDACRVDSDISEMEGRSGRSTPNNIYGDGMGADIGETWVPSQSGRFPANLLHDRSDEVLAAFPDTKSGLLQGHHVRSQDKQVNTYGKWADGAGSNFEDAPSYGDSGSAARFFYSAKAGPLDRLGTEHTTVKPVDVMRWLCRLATPRGGVILDPFAGSGTTGIAALAEGFNAELIELLPDHVADIETKLAHLRGEGARIVERHLKRKAARAKVTTGGLFGDAL